MYSVLKNDMSTLWQEASGAQRWLYVAGLVLIAGGLVHVGVWWIVGGAWSGPVSWRKPILFGISTGVTCLSLAWVLGLFEWNRLGGTLAVVAGGAAVVEVGLITMQTWRGVPSHFNVTTPLDAGVNYIIDVLISVLTLIIAVITLRSFRVLRRRSGVVRTDLALAVRAGMVLLLVSCLFGFWMLIYGTSRVQAGLSPEIFGQSGVVKFVHGMPMHAIQLLPIASWLMYRGALATTTRLWTIGLLAAGFITLTLFAGVQTFSGRSRLDVTFLSGTLLTLGLLLSLSPACLILHPFISCLRAT